MNPIINVDVPRILLTSRYLFFSIANSFDLKSKATVAGITAKLIMPIASLISLNSGNAIRSMSDKTKIPIMHIPTDNKVPAVLIFAVFFLTRIKWKYVFIEYKR